MNLVLRSPAATLRNVLIRWLLLAVAYLDDQPKKKPHWGSTPYIKNRPALLMQDEIALALGHPARALIFQKVTEWCSYNEHANNLSNFHDGHWWTRMPYSKWAELIRWRNARTLRADIRWMEKKGVLISAQFRTEDGESDKWYRVDSAVMDALLAVVDSPSLMDSVSSRMDKNPREGVKVPASITTKNPNLKGKNKTTKLNAATTTTLTPAVVVVDQPLPEPKGESGEHCFEAEGHDKIAVKAFASAEQRGNDSPTSPVPPNPFSQIVAEMIDFGIAPNTALRLGAQYDAEDIRLLVDYARRQSSFKNPPGWVIEELDTGKWGVLAMLKASRKPLGRTLSELVAEQSDYDQERIEELAAREHIPPLPDPVGVNEIASGNKTASEVWRMAYHQLSSIWDRVSFEAWLSRSHLIRFDASSMTYTIGVPTQAAQDNLQHRHYRVVQRAVAGLHTAPVTLVFEVVPPLPLHQQPLSASERDELHRLREDRAHV